MIFILNIINFPVHNGSIDLSDFNENFVAYIEEFDFPILDAGELNIY